MELSTNKAARPAWRVYIAGWLIYIVIVAFVVQIDNVFAARFDWWLAVESGWSTVPPALLLASVWPLTGYLEREDKGRAILIGMHVCGAVLFALISHFQLLMLIGEKTKPLSWYAWPFMYSLMTYTFIAGIFHTVRANAKAQRQAVAAQEAQKLLIAAELDALRSKLNPHFLFNTLHSIIALTRKDPNAAEAALFQFSDMLRYVLETERSGNDRVSLAQEIDFVRDYLELEALRLGERLRVEWDLDPDGADHIVPALSLQPLVENSIKHAFNPHSRPGTLVIQTRYERHTGDLGVTIRDDGPGADAERLGECTGLGLRTVRQRLLLDYGQRAALVIDTAPGAGFAVSMLIPSEPARRAA